MSIRPQLEGPGTSDLSKNPVLHALRYRLGIVARQDYFRMGDHASTITGTYRVQLHLESKGRAITAKRKFWWLVLPGISLGLAECLIICHGLGTIKRFSCVSIVGPRMRLDCMRQTDVIDNFLELGAMPQ